MRRQLVGTSYTYTTRSQGPSACSPVHRTLSKMRPRSAGQPGLPTIPPAAHTDGVSLLRYYTETELVFRPGWFEKGAKEPAVKWRERTTELLRFHCAAPTNSSLDHERSHHISKASARCAQARCDNSGLGTGQERPDQRRAHPFAVVHMRQ